MKNFLKSRRVFVIAEAGVNHNGSPRIAERLVVAARRAGADAVKFQTFKADRVVSSAARNVGYQERTVGKGRQLDMIRRLELDEDAHRQILTVCHREKVTFLSTPFDEESADLLDRLGVPTFKIPSGEVTNIPFLKYIARKGRPIILSTGMSDLAEVRDAVRAIHSTGNKALTLLHCVTEYPAPADQLNLRAMGTLQKEFGLPVGFSDHSLGIVMSCAAVAMGACVIEKHLTLDRKLEGPDHKASLEPDEFRDMVQAIRNIEQALGDGIKRPAQCERKYIAQVRRSLIAARDISRGDRLTLEDICIKRPGWGIPPKALPTVVGCQVKRKISYDQTITWDMIR